jgi:L-arabinose transport system ATP-binding protein
MPADAIAAGIAVIYQELHLVPELSVAENVMLGHLPSALGVVRGGELRAKALRLLGELGETIDPCTPVGRLPIGQRQMVEIAKALSRGAEIIAFDEPTSSLSARETERLFRAVEDLKARGCAVLYVSHRLEEVFQICSAATVLRDGRHVRTHATLAGVSVDQIVREMVGRELADVYGYEPRRTSEPALEVRGLRGPGLSAPASLAVAQGEIVGVFGLVGAGRSELLRIIFGAARRTAGEVRVCGLRVDLRSPREAIDAGVVLCPEDRKQDGIIPMRSVLENINISARRRAAVLGLVVNEGWERANAAEQIARLGVRTPSAGEAIARLSGGNQQKAILARWLSENVKVLLLDEPTRGIDVGAKREIYAIMYELARRGVGILMVSSELPEVLGVSDRVVVMRQGRISGELARAEASEERALRFALPQAG